MNSTTSGLRNLNKQRYLSQRVPLLPLDEQRRIAAILDKADAIRRKRQQAISLTEELLCATFLDMFGDPGANPKNWPVVQMDSLILDSSYGTSEKANEDGRGIPIIRMNNITYQGGIDLSSIKWVEFHDTATSKWTVRRGDLLFNRTNSPELVGKAAVWNLDAEYALAGYLIRIRFHEQKAHPDYVSGFLNSQYGKQYLFAKAKPSNNMSNFSAGMFKEIPIPAPPIQLQQEYAALVAATNRFIRRLEIAHERADSLFHSLVLRAFRGEL